MADLIERLAKATEGSQELDAAVVAHVVGGITKLAPNGKWCVYRGTDRHGDDRLWEPRGDYETALWRSYIDNGPTRSIDAALTLVPEGAEYEISTLYGIARVSLPLNAEETHQVTRKDGNVILAIVTAALKARSTKEPG